MKGIILSAGTASLLAVAGITLATPPSAAPAASMAAASAPAQCLPVPVVGLACGALGIIPGVGH